MNIIWLDTLPGRDPLQVGGKAAQLGRLAAQYPVPPGFCLEAAQRTEQILSPVLHAQLSTAYRHLATRCRLNQPAVAVRSSAVDEDGQQTSFAGQHDSYLNVRGTPAVAEAVRRCWASALTERAVHYRQRHGLSSESGVAVLVQQLIMADVSAVVFSADPRTGDTDQIVINATWGLGESLVGGSVTPDLYLVRKRDLKIVERQVSAKLYMTVAGTDGTREVAVPRGLQTESTLRDDQIVALARLARALELNQGWPVDVECAYQDEQVYLLQCRPITTLFLSAASALQGTSPHSAG
ncbi:Prodigiosin synthesizing transferase PigC [Thermoflexales bacterium]|nr:Prodigiosin synthesizing transferase PigC [Thermoflexales bacterium]